MIEESRSIPKTRAVDSGSSPFGGLRQVGRPSCQEPPPVALPALPWCSRRGTTDNQALCLPETDLGSLLAHPAPFPFSSHVLHPPRLIHVGQMRPRKLVARRKDETDDEFTGRGGITKHLHDAPASQSGGVRTSVPLSFSSSQTQSMIDAAQPGQRNMDGWI